MTITPDTTVAEIATTAPATIPVFQQYQIDFCCGGKIPLAQACAAQGVDTDTVLAALEKASRPSTTEPSWAEAPLRDLITHIQQRYHEHLRAELPRLGAMLDRVVSRHGEHLPETLLPLQRTFEALSDELLAHMQKEDRVLFPFIVALQDGHTIAEEDAARWLDAPIAAMETEHESAGAALASMREVTNGYAPPDWACPTFRGLYFGLAQLETDMHVHVHLENHILFPRAAQLVHSPRASS